MNAPSSTMLRALRGLGYAGLLLSLFEACSGDEASTATPPPGPANVEISGIALGHGLYTSSDPATSLLGCDYTIGVNVQLTNWTLVGPGRCAGTLQCGQLRVRLLDGDGSELLQVMAAGNGVALDVRSVITSLPPEGKHPYAVKVELVEDSGSPYLELDGGNGAAQMDFEMQLPTPDDCRSNGSAGGGGGLATAGAAGDRGLDDDAGTGGATAGTGGATAGTGGATAGTGGATAGTGGATAGTGGATAGTGGANAGTGGANAGTSGANAGTGGANAGTGGSAQQ